MSGHHTGSGFGTGPGQPAGGAGGAAAGVGAAADDAFTAEMRDQQARGKDPYESSDGSSDWTSEGSRYRAGGGKDEPFAILERRRVAAQVLDSPELLMMAAQRDNESIPATRLRYTRMLCGFEEPPAPPPARKKSHRAGVARSSRKDAR
ncbi:acetyl-coenzyme A synthetase 2 [Hypoxylon texense]